MGITLRAARVNKGLTQKQAAERLTISKDTLGNYEAGKTFPNHRVIEKIEEVYGITYDEIIFLPKNNA